jgi:hypothetical protein
MVARNPPTAGPIAMPRLIASRYTANADLRCAVGTASPKNAMAAGRKDSVSIARTKVTTKIAVCERASG